MLITDSEPESQVKPLLEFFLSAEAEENQNGDLEQDGLYHFQMPAYKTPFPDPFGDGLELFDGRDQPKTSVDVGGSLLTTISLPSTVKNVRVDVEKSDCLTMFIFLEKQKESQIESDEASRRVTLDLASGSPNTFARSLRSFWTYSAGSSHNLLNHLYDESLPLYLKVFCPFFSSSGSNQITLGIKLEYEKPAFDGSPITLSRQTRLRR